MFPRKQDIRDLGGPLLRETEETKIIHPREYPMASSINAEEPTAKRSRRSSELAEDGDSFRTIVLDMAKYRDWVRELSSEQLVAIFEIGLKIRESTTVTVDVSESYLKNELSAAMKPVQTSLQSIENKIQSELSKKLVELSTSLKVSPYVIGIVGEKEVMKLLEEHFPNFLVKDVSRQPGKGDILVVSLRQHKFMIEVKNRDSSNVPQSEIDRFKSNLASSPDVRAGILLSLKSGIVNKAKTGKFQVIFRENQYQIYVPNAGKDGALIIWSVLMADELAQSMHGDLGTSQIQKLEELYKEFQETKDHEKTCRDNLVSLENAAKALKESMNFILKSIDKTRKNLKKLIDSEATAAGKPIPAVQVD